MKRTSKALTAAILIFYSLFIVFAFAVGFFVIRGIKEEVTLENEFSAIEDLIDNSSIDNTQIDYMLNNFVTTGDYLNVEKAIKDYLEDLLVECRRLDNIFQSQDLTNVLSLYNFDADAPYFYESQHIIENYYQELKNIKTNLINLLDTDSIISYAEAYQLQDYYLDYFKNLIIDENMLNTNRNDIENSLDYALNTLDIYKELFELLSNNVDSWTMDEDYIYFDNDNLLEEYNRLIEIINNMDFYSDVESFIWKY